MKPVAVAPLLAGAVTWWTAAPAAADGPAPGMSTGSPALSWISFTDSHGVPLWNLEISLDQGSVSSPANILWSAFIQMFWDLYRNIVALAIWFIDWALSFTWLEVVATPAVTLSQGLRDVVDRFGAVPMLLTVAAIVAVVWMARGRWTTGIFELVMSLLIATVAAGVFLNPVNNVAGSDGWLLQSRDLGMQIAGGMAGDDTAVTATGESSTADPNTLREDLTKQMVTIFIRKPLQLLNFGQQLDDGPCAGAYQDALMAGPYGTNPEIREAVGGCDEELLPYAESPGPAQLVSALVLFPAAVIILLFGAVLGGGVLVSALMCLYQALKAIVVLLIGLLPGRARGALWITVADLAISLATVVFSIVFLSIYLLLLGNVFGNANSGGIMPTFFFVDILLVVGIVMYWRGRGMLKRASRSLAQTLASRPTGTPARPGAAVLPSPAAAITAGALAGQASTWYRHRQLMSRGGGKPSGETSDQDSSSTSGPAAGATATTGKWATRWRNRRRNPGPDARPHPGPATPGYTAQPQLDSPDTTPQLEPGPTPRPGGGRLWKVTRLGGTIAAHTAAAAATGGTSTVASAAAAATRTQRVARTAQTVHRTARHAQLAAQLASSRTRPAVAATPDPSTRRPVIITGQVTTRRTDPPPRPHSAPAGRPPALRPQLDPAPATRG